MQLTRAEQKPSIDGVFSHRLNPDGSSCWMTEGEIATAVATSFYKAASDHKHSVAEDLRAALDLPAKAYLIDLRSTRGGSGLDGAAEVADLFLKKGLIARNSSRRVSEEITARAENDLPEVPMAVLVNGATSFGAEIVAAALQDHRRAAVIGRRTAGRALVREYFEVPGAGSLILPVSEVFRSSGANLERLVHMTGNDTWGVIPDLIVPLPGAPNAETGTGNASAMEENYQRLWDSTPADQRDAALKKDVQFQAALEYLRKELAKK
jgi:carboxyl-terminal processing protease